MLKIGDKVRIKSAKELQSITGIGFNAQVQLKNGLMFGAVMLNYAGLEGEITKIAFPNKDNQITTNTYKLGDVELYWNEELLIKV